VRRKENVKAGSGGSSIDDVTLELLGRRIKGDIQLFSFFRRPASWVQDAFCAAQPYLQLDFEHRVSSIQYRGGIGGRRANLECRIGGQKQFCLPREIAKRYLTGVFRRLLFTCLRHRYLCAYKALF